MTYIVSSGTLNPTIPYHTIVRVLSCWWNVGAVCLSVCVVVLVAVTSAAE